MELATLEIFVHVPSMGRRFGPAKLEVRIENTAESDAPATPISCLSMHLPDLDLSSDRTLRVELPYIGTAVDLTVAATVARAVPLQPAARDFVTAAAVPVVAGRPAHVRLSATVE